MSLTVQFYTMLAMIGMGSFFGAALDTYRRLIKRSDQKRWYVFINDILFWILQALLIFYVLYLVNNGEIRFYIFVALVCGFAAYQSLLKSIYNWFLERAIRISVSLYQFSRQFVTNLLIRPIMLLITFCITAILAILKLLWGIFLTIGKLLFSILKFLYSPFVLFGKFIWNRMPKSFTMKVYNLFHTIYKFILLIKNKWFTITNKK